MAVHSFNWNGHHVPVASSVSSFAAYNVVRGSKVVPASHIEDSTKLEADGMVDLFQIDLADQVTKLYLKMNSSVSWNGQEYQGTGIKLSGVAQYSDQQTGRPTLMLFNPGRIFNSLVDDGLLEGGYVTRYRVLKEHVDNNIPVFQRQRWRLTRVASVRGDTISCELRDMMDGQNFVVPGRMFIPPEFPSVSI